MQQDPTMRDYEIAEYQSLRQEILESDKTCILLMQYLILLTAATVGLLINNVDLREYIPLFGAILSSIWILGFLYISEKRYVIKRAAFYIHRQFEYNNNRFGWQEFQRNLHSRGLLRILNLSPYQIEALVCAIMVIVVIPNATSNFKAWDYWQQAHNICQALSWIFIIVGGFTFGYYHFWHDRSLKRTMKNRHCS